VRLIAEAIPPNPAVAYGLAALFTLAAVIVAIGMVKLVNAIARSFFGTVSGLVGWIPFAGEVLETSLHKIEQKISHGLGSAERTLDAHIATTWHTLARTVTRLANDAKAAAVFDWRMSKYLNAFATVLQTRHLIKTATAPITAANAGQDQAIAQERARQRALHKSVAQGVYPRLKANEVYDRTVTKPATDAIRSEAKAAEAQAIALYRWLVRHRTSVLAGAFVGAAAWALTRLGGGWIRCKNWRAIGKKVCSLPWSLIESLLGLGLAFGVVIDPLATAKVAVTVEDAMDGLIRKIAD